MSSTVASPPSVLKDTGMTVTSLMPGPTETEFFERADVLDTKVGAGEKAEMHRKVAEPGSAKEARPSLTRPGPGSRRSRSAPCGSPRRRFAPR